MQFFTIIILTAAAVNAIALPEANPAAEACNQIGQPCWVVKRAAEAFAEAMVEENVEEGLVARQSGSDCKKKFMPCWKAKRDAEALASALASAQEDPSTYAAGLDLERRFPAEAEEETLVARQSGSDCKKKFMPCWKAKRTAEAEAEAACNMPGQPCWVVKRAAAAVELVVREPQTGLDCKKKFSPCHKAKRDISKVQNFARYVLDDE